MKKNVVILGSTGSIGVNSLNVIREFPEMFNVVALSVNSNIDLLKTQIEEFNPLQVVVTNESAATKLRSQFDSKCEVLSGENSLLEITKSDNYDILVSALVGFAGLAPTIESIKLGKRIALANKETLVVAGEIINKMCKEYNSELLPVDSEHSAIFQCLVGENIDEVEKIILTASGGPFLNKSKADLSGVSLEQALAHPNWSMGNKITIDSATMMNKGLEVIEAHWLFNLPSNRLEVVVHPQSIIHSMVEFIDGSIKAQLSLPDMKLPIQYALSYPNRIRSRFVNTNFPEIGQLTFFEPDMEKFECLKLAYDVMEHGGTSACILNAANEEAVAKFLDGKIGFTEIPELIKRALDNIENNSQPDLETIFESDRLTRDYLSKF